MGPALAPQASPDAEAPPLLDAGPRIFAEDEVDVPARPIEPLRPAYPPGLRALGLEGEVEARVIVWADGSLRGGRILRSSHQAFETAVRDSLADARFAPAERAGRPVPSTVTLVLRFRLDR